MPTPTPTPDAPAAARPIRLAEKLAAFADHFNPRIIAELNGQEIRLVKFAAPFIWHAYPDADEAFLVISGTMRIGIRDTAGDPTTERHELVGPGQLIVLPAGLEHRPDTADGGEIAMLCFEKAGCLNTGDAAPGTLTRQALGRI